MKNIHVHYSLMAMLLLNLGYMVGCRESSKSGGQLLFSDELARSMVVDHYKKSEKSLFIDTSKMTLRSVGDNYRVIYVYSKGISPAFWTGWVVGHNNYLKPLDVESLRFAFCSSRSATSDAEQIEHARLFIDMLAAPEEIIYGREKVVGKLEDIPKYSESPIDPDISDSISPPYKPSDNELIIFTYQQIGGGVYRYKFYFDQYGIISSASRSELDRGVGDAFYLQ